jgi:hypothetical protein
MKASAEQKQNLFCFLQGYSLKFTLPKLSKEYEQGH